jgi:hypothetical protein
MLSFPTFLPYGISARLNHSFSDPAAAIPAPPLAAYRPSLHSLYTYPTTRPGVATSRFTTRYRSASTAWSGPSFSG